MGRVQAHVWVTALGSPYQLPAVVDPAADRPGALTLSSPHLVPSGTGSYAAPPSRARAWQVPVRKVRVQELRSGGFRPPSQ